MATSMTVSVGNRIHVTYMQIDRTVLVSEQRAGLLPFLDDFRSRRASIHA
jgi:hypothetical protein